MKTSFGIAIAATLVNGCLLAAFAAPAPAQPVPAAYMQQGPWDAPPPELDEVSRRGFHDGVEGARKDYGNHRRPDVNNRDEFRHPHVPERDREAYRHGFERGYQVAVDHLYHGRL